MIRERAPGKVNLVLRVGPVRADGLHEIASIFASIELADELAIEEAPEGDADVVLCPGVPEPNLVSTALAAFRRWTGADLPPLQVEIEKRLPIAAGLGGGSADAAAALRAANRLAGEPLDAATLRELGAEVGADVPSQVEPGHAIVTGAGENVEAVALRPATLVLIPHRRGLSTAAVYAEADRLPGDRDRLDPDVLRALASRSLPELADGLRNDLEPAALSLRPELVGVLEDLRARGALAARLTGSGPTAFGVFAERAEAEAAAAALPDALVTALRGTGVGASG